jgi:hypothetical protein
MKKNNLWLDMFVILILFFKNMFIKKQSKTSVTVTIEKNIRVTIVNFICPEVHICMCPWQVYNGIEQNR